MATSTRPDDARRERADARRERRSSAPQRERQQQKKRTGDGGGSRGGSGGGGPSTGALVAIGAAVGGAAGITKAVRDRRRASRRDGDDADRGPVEAERGGEFEQADEQEGERREREPQRQRSRSRGTASRLQQQPSQLRDLAATVLEAALEAVREQSGRHEDDHDDRAREPQVVARSDRREQEDEDEEDDEEDELPRGAAGDSTARTDDDDDDAPADDDPGDHGDPAPRGDESNGHRHRGVPVELVRQAKTQLAELVGREPEAVTSVEHDDDGWRLELQVVEVERIPSSTDVLASYEVHVDEDGSLVDYARTRRYHRSQADGEGP